MTSDASENPTTVDRDVGLRLQQARWRARMSIPELCDRTSLTRAELEAMENGNAVIYVTDLIKLCRALGTNPHRLLGWYAGKDNAK